MKATVATENKNMMWNANQMVAFMEANRPNLKNAYKRFEIENNDNRVDEALFGKIFCPLFDKVSARYNAEEDEQLSEKAFGRHFNRAWREYCADAQSLTDIAQQIERKIMKVYGYKE